MGTMIAFLACYLAICAAAGLAVGSWVYDMNVRDARATLARWQVMGCWAVIMSTMPLIVAGCMVTTTLRWRSR